MPKRKKVIKKRAKKRMHDFLFEKGDPGTTDVQLAGFNLY